jgi:hypothetical protein
VKDSLAGESACPTLEHGVLSLLTIVVVNDYYEFVAGKLQQEIHQTKAIRLVEEEAALNIVRTADMLMLAVTAC